MQHNKFAPFYILGCIFYFISCSKPVDTVLSSGVEQIRIDANQIHDILDVSDWVEEIKVIPLQEEEGNFVEEVWKVLLHQDHYLIFDRYNKGLFVFDENGKFIRNLVNLGEGPKDLSQPNDVWLNEKGQVEVYDNLLKKILVYNDDYEVARELYVKQPRWYKSIINLPNGSGYLGYAAYNHGPFEGKYYKLAFLDSRLGISSSEFEYDEELSNAWVSTPMNPFVRIGDSLRFFQNYDPYIYNIAPSGDITKKYELVYSPNPLPRDFEDQLIQKNLKVFKAEEGNLEAQRAIFNGFTGFRGSWWESKKYAIFDSFNAGYHSFTTFYDKGKGEIIFQGSDWQEKEKYQMALPTYYHTVEAESNRFVTAMMGHEIKHYIQERSPLFHQIHEDLEGFYMADITFK